jgi:cytochrome P450
MARAVLRDEGRFGPDLEFPAFGIPSLLTCSDEDHAALHALVLDALNGAYLSPPALRLPAATDAPVNVAETVLGPVIQQRIEDALGASRGTFAQQASAVGLMAAIGEPAARRRDRERAAAMWARLCKDLRTHSFARHSAGEKVLSGFEGGEELLSFVFAAGYETSLSLVTHALALAVDEGLDPSEAVVEALRRQHPVSIVSRRALVQTSLDSQVVQVGARVVVDLQTADAPSGIGLAFGAGRHRCPGAAFARRTAEAIVSSVVKTPWLRRDLRIVPPSRRRIVIAAPHRLMWQRRDEWTT